MPTRLDHRDNTAHFLNRRNTTHKPPPPLAILTVQPLLVVTAHVHRAVEFTRPFQMRRVKVRVADDDSLEPALGRDEVDGRLVKQRNAVPEYVAGRCLEQDGALADAELFACGAEIGKARGKLGGC